MANNYKKVMTTVTSTGDASIYTVPAETTTLVKTAWAYNNSGGSAVISLKINTNMGLLVLIMLPGVFFGFLALIWRPKVLQVFPMALRLAFIGMFLPYVYFANPGYPPRYSIHLLPLAFLSMMIVFDGFFKTFFLRNSADKN